MVLRFLVLALALVMGGCQGGDGSDTGDAEASSFLSVSPPVGGQGRSLTLQVEATRSAFDYEDTQVDLGEGIVVDEVQVLDGWELEADISIDPDAELGDRDVLVTSGHRDWTVEEGFCVVAESLEVDPASGMLGETLTVEILGTQTAWREGETWPSFGDGIDILSFTVYSETYATAELSIASDAHPGARDVLMETGTDVVTLYDGFQVDRVGMAASFDPEEAAQGETVTFTIEGRGTGFDADETEVLFYLDGGETSDIVVDTLTVVDSTNLNGRMTLSNAAELGLRDVLVVTGEEGVMISDAFEVTEGEIDLDDVAVSLAFNVTRAIDNSTGEVSEDVLAYAMFYIPLDPPCGSSSMSSGPQPYDVNGVFEYPESSEEDCPTPQTVGAGDYVWLESDANTVTLERVEDSSSGTIYYYGYDLTIDDYAFDQWYDLHTQGEEGGVQEYLVEDVQPTVPANWELLTPDLWGDYTQSRSEDFTYTWTPAETYPDAYFMSGIQGTIEETGNSGYAGCIPWDDGEHTYTSSELSALAAGPVYFYAMSYIEGVEWGLPDSSIQTNATESYVYLQAYMVLE